MKAALLAAMLLPSAALANAPFCLVTSSGSQCHYWDLNACRQAASTLQGMCAANPQAMQPQPTYQPQPQPRPVIYDPNAGMQRPNFVDSYQRGYESGQRMRQQREEHEARIRVLEAQEAAYRAQAQPVQQAPALAVETAPAADAELYKCRSEQGAIRYAASPIAGLSCEHLGAVSAQSEPAEPAPKRGPTKSSFQKN